MDITKEYYRLKKKYPIKDFNINIIKIIDQILYEINQINTTKISYDPERIFDERENDILYILNIRNVELAFGKFKFSSIKEKKIDDFKLPFEPKIIIGPPNEEYKKYYEVGSFNRFLKLGEIFSTETDKYFLLMFIGKNKQLMRGQQNSGIFFIGDTVLKLGRIIKERMKKLPKIVLDKYPKNYVVDKEFLLNEKIMMDLGDYFFIHYPRQLLIKYKSYFSEEEFKIIDNFHKEYGNWIPNSMSFPPKYLMINIPKIQDILHKFINIIQEDISEFIFFISNLYLKYQEFFQLLE